jgi:hypothetical protein
MQLVFQHFFSFSGTVLQGQINLYKIKIDVSFFWTSMQNGASTSSNISHHPSNWCNQSSDNEDNSSDEKIIFESSDDE